MPDCLVLMPFRKKLESHFSIIKECGERLGFTVYRVDTHRFSGNIIEAIAKALSKADLIVADLTGNNPNVLYELALAHSLGKKVLMVTNDRNTIPFDISMYKPSFVQCVARTALICLLPILTYGISILWALKGPGYRTLHDIATRTRVVKCN
jgi:hypothetical protein